MTYEYSARSSLTENGTRLKYAVVSDIYKAMQSRLDGYRQSAGAVFLAVLAAVLTFDGSFLKLFIDKSLAQGASQCEQVSLGWIVIGAGAVILCICGAAVYVICRIGIYFAEMTSIIYKIDEANAVFEEGAWIDGATLYPRGFRRGQRTTVGIDPADHDLRGWRDSAIDTFKLIIIILCVSQIIFFWGLYASLLPGAKG